MKLHVEYLAWILILSVVLFLLMITTGHAQLKPAVITNEGYAYLEKVADAIYLAEGGEDATYKYGIRSVAYTDEKDARAICLRTLRRNVQRYFESPDRESTSYLQFVANRYCPIGAKNDPEGLNVHFLNNVQWFLAREAK